MSMKRKSPYEIDPKYQDGADEDEQPDLGKISTSEEIQQRKILKIGGNKTAEETKEVKFSLLNNLKQVNNTDEKEGDKPVSFIKNQEDKPSGSSLFDNSKVQQQQKQEKNSENNGKAVELSEQDKTKVTESIFNIAQGKSEVKSSGLFNNSGNEKKGGLFDNIPQTSGGLFGQSSSSSAGGLFANTTQNSGTGLFSNPKPSGGLFANNDNNNKSENKGGLFSNSGNTSTGGGLFSNLSNNNQSGGLFGNSGATNNNNNKDEGDEDGEDEGEVSGQNTPEIDKTQAPKFEYQDIMEKIFDKEIEKIRKNTNEIQEKGYVSIERLKGKPESGSVLVYRNKIKQIVYQGNLIKKLSQFKTINNKPENQQITCVNQETDEDNKTKYVKDILKIKFLDAKDGMAFQDKVKELVSE